jgi:hypothetical protein
LDAALFRYTGGTPLFISTGVLAMACRIALVALLSLGILSATGAQEPAKTAPQAAASPTPEMIRKLTDELTNVKLIGRFTITGKEDQAPKEEEYTISSALKLPEGDTWLLKARIKYGNKDATVPIPLEIKWASDTPVITLTNLAIPGLGTFSSRVVIYEGRYAGTWQHGDVGGHLFGRLEKMETPDVPPPAK